MKPILPEHITCLVTSTCQPVTGVMLLTEFSVIKKNPYTFVWGMTGCDGLASLNRTEIQHEAIRQRNMAIMDFEPLEIAFSGTLRTHIMSVSDIDNALNAYGLFREVTRFPENYEQRLKSARMVMSQIDIASLHCRITIVVAEGEKIRHYISQAVGTEICSICSEPPE